MIVAALVVIALADQPAKLEVDERWKVAAVEAPDAPALVLRDGDKTVAVTVAMLPGTRDRVDELVAGWDDLPDVSIVDRKATTIDGVPVLDLRIKRGKQTLGVRMLLFRSRVITAVSEGDVAAAKALSPQI